MENNFSSRLNKPYYPEIERVNFYKKVEKEVDSNNFIAQCCICSKLLDYHAFNLIQTNLFEIKKDLSTKKPTLLNSVLKIGNDFYHAEKTNLGYKMVTSFNGLT